MQFREARSASSRQPELAAYPVRFRRWSSWLAVGLFGLLGASSVLAQGGVEGDPPPLTLNEVLASVTRHHPTLEVARQDVRGARAFQLEARGNFDTTLSGNGLVRPYGTYEWGRLDVQIEQPTQLWGTRWYTGWRGAAGQLPPYYGPVPLGRYGEVRAGVAIPLWLDGPIDPARAQLRAARHGIDAAQQGLEDRLRILQRDAAQAYWRWVAAGRRHQIAQDLLSLAETRDDQLRRMVEAGAVPELELLENRRTMLVRQQAVLLAQRGVEQSAIALSLYYRAADGAPRIPRSERSPRDIAMPVEIPDLELGLRHALAHRPELEQFRAFVRQSLVELELAENRFAPRVDLGLEAALGLGDHPEEVPYTASTRFDGMLSFSLPLWFRGARGRIEQTRADLAALRADSVWIREQIEAEVRDAHSALRVAAERAVISREGAEVAESVTQAERRRFQLGEATLFIVNLREEATAEALSALVDAEAEVQVARAFWQAAIAGF